MEFVEVVLAVGDALQAAIAQLRRRRQQVVEGMKASIEIKAAMMPATEGEAPQSQLFGRLSCKLTKASERLLRSPSTEWVQ